MDRTNRRMNLVVTAAGLCAMLALPSVGTADDKQLPSIEAMAVAAAKTPEQHMALAAYYREKAAGARADAQRHVGMAEAFVNARSANTLPAMRQHCDSLAKAAREQAATYDAMASEHEAEAKKAGK